MLAKVLTKGELYRVIDSIAPAIRGASVSCDNWNIPIALVWLLSREKNQKNDWFIALLCNNVCAKGQVKTWSYKRVIVDNVCAYIKNEYTRLWQWETWNRKRVNSSLAGQGLMATGLKVKAHANDPTCWMNVGWFNYCRCFDMV